MNNKQNEPAKSTKSNNGGENKAIVASAGEKTLPTRKGFLSQAEEKMRRIRQNLVAVSLCAILASVLLFGTGEQFSKTHARWFQLSNSLASNDNSENYSNHHYGKDMMKTAEPDSIFMTEGGDNQVFGLLYFSLAENRRPDIDFFDQKGNVFPRLYGDFIGYDPKEIELIRFYRDYQLFSTGRPVYLTWKRKEMAMMNPGGLIQKKASVINAINLELANENTPARKANYLRFIKKNIENRFRVESGFAFEYTVENMVSKNVYSGVLRNGKSLYQQDFKEFGPWYLKTTGLLHRVTPFRYAFVDMLARYGENLSKQRLYDLVENHTRISQKQFSFDSFMQQLQDEGLVVADSNGLRSIKRVNFFMQQNNKTAGMENLDYWANYNFFFLETPNAPKWDPLTRQIFNNYLFKYTEALISGSSQLRLFANLEKMRTQNQQDTQALFEQSEKYATRAYFLRSKMVDYAHDNPRYLTSAAKVFNDRGDHQKAIDAFIQAAKSDVFYSANYSEANAIALKQLLPKLETKQEKIALLKTVISRYYTQIEQRKRFLRFTGKSKAEIEQENEILMANSSLEQALKMMSEL